MPVIRIVKSWTNPDLLQQSPGGNGVWGDCRFTLDPVERCDYLLVLNHVPSALTVTVPPENVWCLVQEPPEPEFRWMRKGFAQFARVYTQDTDLRGAKFIPHHGALPWHVGRTYDELISQPLSAKTRPLSWITSNLAKHPGHRRRLKFLERLRRSVDFDLFGRGFNPIASKWDGLAPYRYAVAVENRSVPHYWTEKIADCFLAGTMPLYFGAENIADYFPAESFVWIDIDDPAAPQHVAEIIRSDLAERRRDAILEARRRILEEHQLFPMVAGLVTTANKHNPPPAARLMQFPGLPDLTHYYRKNGPVKRAWKSVSRNVRHVLGIGS